MKFKLNWTPSEELRQAHLIATGERMDIKPSIDVELAELTPEQRAIILACKVKFVGDQASIPQLCVGVKNPSFGYGTPEFETGGSVVFDAVPTTEQWLDKAIASLATYEQHRPQLDALRAERKERERRAQELTAAYRKLQEEWRPKIAAMTETEANQPLPEHIRQMEKEIKEGGGTINGGKLSDDMYAHWTSLRNARIKAEAAEAKRIWIEAHGSDQLRRGFERGHDCGRLYTLERAALEAPGFTVDYYGGAAWKDRSCPSVAALDEAEAAEALDIGEVKIVWLTEPPVDTKYSGEEYGYYDEPLQACEAMVISRYLDKYDLVKVV